MGSGLAVALGLALVLPASASPDPPALGPGGGPARTEAPDLALPPVPGEIPAEGRPTEVQRLWRERGAGAEGIERVEAAGRELGVANFDAAARALLQDAPRGRRLAAARQALGLAPDLPIVRIAQARALWEEEGRLAAAIGAALAGVAALGRHLEASLWLRASVLHGAALTLFWGGAAFLAVAFVQRARALAHDLGDRLSLETPAFGRALLLGCAVLAPAAFGAGWLGVALGLFTVVFAWADTGLRRALAAAALAIGLGLFPGLRLAGGAMATLAADPVALAAYAVETETASPWEIERLERAAGDPLAARALAVRARRGGDLALADARYETLLSSGLSDASLVNNAANVRLALGDVHGAIALYEQVAGPGASPVVLFNLSHAYGAAIRPELQEETLARAQSIDAELVGALTDLLGTTHRGLVVDLPYSQSGLRGRLLSAPLGAAAAAELRRSLAPGTLGRSAVATALAFGLAAGVALLLGRGHPASRRCDRCGVRRCPRCDDPSESRTLCESCARALHRPDVADAAQRSERLAALQSRQRRTRRARLAADAVVPGAAGLLAGRPLLGVAGALALVGAFVAAGFAGEAVADPLAAGGAGALARGLAALLLLLAHASVVALARAQRRD